MRSTELRAISVLSQEPDSEDAAREVCTELRAALQGAAPKAILLYATVDHDFPLVLAALGDEFGPEVPVVGCSSGGLVSNNDVVEDSWALGVMAFIGEGLRFASAVESEIATDPFASGSRLGEALTARLGGPPKLALLFYDPLSGVDASILASGLSSKVGPVIVGGGAGQPWGPPTRTWQFHGREAMSRSAAVLAIDGPFVVNIGLSHGTDSLGASSVVTRASGNRVFELDGRSATTVFQEISGFSFEDGSIHQSLLASWAMGVEREVAGEIHGETRRATLVRSVFGFDLGTGAAIFQSALPEGTRVSMQHRTVDRCLAGAATMKHELRRKMGNKLPWAVLSFECAARTSPFLGPESTRLEHADLRKAVGAATPWLGMMAWGEIAPVGNTAEFHNYTYPIVALTRIDSA